MWKTRKQKSINNVKRFLFISSFPCPDELIQGEHSTAWQRPRQLRHILKASARFHAKRFHLSQRAFLDGGDATNNNNSVIKYGNVVSMSKVREIRKLMNEVTIA